MKTTLFNQVDFSWLNSYKLSIRLLVIDDEENTCKSVASSMGKYLPKGAKIVIAQNWNEAEELYLNIKPNLVIVDYKLPEEDTGIELIKFLSRFLGHTQWYLISGYDPNELSISMYKEETNTFFNYVKKPLNKADYACIANQFNTYISNSSLLPCFLSSSLDRYESPTTQGHEKLSVAFTLVENVVMYLISTFYSLLVLNKQKDVIDFINSDPKIGLCFNKKIRYLDYLFQQICFLKITDTISLDKSINTEIIKYFFILNEFRNKYKGHPTMTPSNEKCMEILNEIRFDKFILFIKNLSYLSIFVPLTVDITENDLYEYNVLNLSTKSSTVLISCQKLKLKEVFQFGGYINKPCSLFPFFQYSYCSKCESDQLFMLHNLDTSNGKYFDFKGHDSDIHIDM